MGLGSTGSHNSPSWAGVRDSAGFTIVELAITLSMIGILASIALPNYQNFLARSRQVEAKLTLSAIYLAEISYFNEYGTFTTCLSDIGYARQATGVYYSAGFTASTPTCGAGTDDCHIRDFRSLQPCPAGAFPAGGFFIADRGGLNIPVSRPTFNANATTSITSSTFRAAVVGQITTRSASVFDVWSITQAKTLLNDRSGL